MKHKKGEVLQLTTGEYSDFQIIAIVKVLKDIDELEVLKLFIPTKKDKYDNDGFCTFLMKEKYVKEIETIEWHYENYGRLETSDRKEVKE
jgi:hypothetical protein